MYHFLCYIQKRMLKILLVFLITRSLIKALTTATTTAISILPSLTLQTENILGKSNFRCCQRFLNSFRDFRDPRKQINQVPPKTINFGRIQRWAKKGTGSNVHEKRTLFQCRNQWYQSIGHYKRMKKHKNTYGKTSSLL